MKRILITGAGGMVGLNLFLSLRSLGYCVEGTNYRSTFPTHDLSTHNLVNACFEFLDLCSEEMIEEKLEKFKPTHIVNLAAQSRPDVSVRLPGYTQSVNIRSMVCLVGSRWMKEYKPTVINFSSSAVYGDINWDHPVAETSMCRPLTPYGASKLAAEALLHTMYEGHAVSFRLFNCCGLFKTNDLISDIASRLSEGDSVAVGDLKTLRHYMHVGDVVDAVRLIVDASQGLGSTKKSHYEVYNISPSHQDVTSGDEVIEIFKEISGRDFKTVSRKSLFRSVDEKVIWGDSSKFSQEYGWRSQKTVTDIIRDVYQYYSELKR